MTSRSCEHRKLQWLLVQGRGDGQQLGGSHDLENSGEQLLELLTTGYLATHLQLDRSFHCVTSESQVIVVVNMRAQWLSLCQNYWKTSYSAIEVDKKISVFQRPTYWKTWRAANTEQLFRSYYFRCFRYSKEEIIINCNSGEINPSFIVKNPHGISRIVTVSLCEFSFIWNFPTHFWKIWFLLPEVYYHVCSLDQNFTYLQKKWTPIILYNFNYVSSVAWLINL
jgi:hypothetical protein